MNCDNNNCNYHNDTIIDNCEKGDPPDVEHCAQRSFDTGINNGADEVTAYVRTFGKKSDGIGVRTHLDGISDSATLCGFDTAGDPEVHSRQPEYLIGKHRVTCADCLAIIETVKNHVKGK